MADKKPLWPTRSFIDMVVSGELDLSDYGYFLEAIDDTPVWERRSFFDCIGLNDSERDTFIFLTYDQELGFIRSVVEKRKRDGRRT